MLSYEAAQEEETQSLNETNTEAYRDLLQVLNKTELALHLVEREKLMMGASLDEEYERVRERDSTIAKQMSTIDKHEDTITKLRKEITAVATNVPVPVEKLKNITKVQDTVKQLESSISKTVARSTSPNPGQPKPPTMPVIPLGTLFSKQTSPTSTTPA